MPVPTLNGNRGLEGRDVDLRMPGILATSKVAFILSYTVHKKSIRIITVLLFH